MRTTAFFILGLLALVSAALAAPAQKPSRFDQLKSTLERLNVWDDYNYYEDLKLWESAQTRQGFETLLKHIDPSGLLKRYASWNDDRLIIYQDRDTKQLVDYEIQFKKDGAPSDPQNLIRQLHWIAKFAPSTQPLFGLRVALDPGHMGSREWDHLDGKFVKVGGYVNEGAMALQTCLLLARELHALGADVMLTRTVDGAVSDKPMKSFDLTPFIARDIRKHTDDAWFDWLFTNPNPERNPQIQSFKSEENRSRYFIYGQDQVARADKITAFKPHVVMIVHFDASHSNELQNRGAVVRGYVAGSVLNGECTSREQIFTTVRSLVAGQRWMQSVDFTSRVTKGISQATHIPVMIALRDHPSGTRVEPGVYARNLALNHMIIDGAMAYLEVLNYDYEPEYRRLAKRDKSADVNGIQFNYSSRLDDIVDGMKRGILDYVQSH